MGEKKGCSHTQGNMRWGRRTEDDAVELVGSLVRVGQQDAAGLEHAQELRLSRLRERGQEGVGALGHALLQHRRVVRHRIDILHTHDINQNQ